MHSSAVASASELLRGVSIFTTQLVCAIMQMQTVNGLIPC